MWLAESTQYIDITREYLLRQCFLISYYSKGGYSYETAVGMTDINFKILVDEAKKIQKILKEETESE